MVYKIHHGFAQAGEKCTLSVVEMTRFQQDDIHAVYIGNLDMRYLDVELLSGIACQFPDVQFHFVGGYEKKSPLRRLAGGLPNVTWWGKVDCKFIPSILEQTDVMLVTYKSSRYKDQASPHKVLEYLASGKVIVATYTDEYKDKRHLLEMVDTNSDFPAAFARVVANLDKYNSPDRQALRKEFARQHSYDKQLDRIFDLLQQHGLDKKLTA
jgi:glycosyltransferase involved in cell wall biosynthesis